MPKLAGTEFIDEIPKMQLYGRKFAYLFPDTLRPRQSGVFFHQFQALAMLADFFLVLANLLVQHVCQ